MKTMIKTRDNKRSILAAILAFMLILGIISTMSSMLVAAAGSDTTNSDWNQEVLRLVNVERTKAGLNELVYDWNLQPYADVRAAEILTYFEHTRPNGNSTFDGRDRLHGENLGLYAVSPAEIVQAWMDSPGHRANILEPQFVTMAVANVIPANDPTGISWVQHFSCYYP